MERTSTRRRSHVKLRKGNHFRRAVHAFHRVQEAAFPVTTHADRRGRARHVGYAARANAFACLMALMTVSQRGRWGRVYLGYDALGGEFRRSRSTAYRAVTLLVAARLIVAPIRKGGKTYDDQGNLIPRANGYELHPELKVGADEPDERPVRVKAQAASGRGLGRRGRQMARLGEERLEAFRERSRAGPAA